MPSRPTLRIGVLLVGTVQLLDLSAIDLFYMIDPAYLSVCDLPKPLVELGRPTEIHYIGKAGSGAIQDTTSNLNLRLTDSLTDAAVQPGKLDIIFIPGPEPNSVPDEEYLDFVRNHYAAGTDVISVCTGILVVGYSGIAKGKRVTGPRFMVPALRKKFPEAAGFDSSLRVVVDGNLWTSGGITNGHDLVGQYLKKVVDEPLVKAVLAAADVPDRGVKYDTSATADNAFFLWQVLKALPSMLFRSIGGK